MYIYFFFPIIAGHLIEISKGSNNKDLCNKDQIKQLRRAKLNKIFSKSVYII